MSKFILTILLCLVWPCPKAMAAVKSGAFVNPITDVAWQEIFPIKIAGITIAGADNYDTPDPAYTRSASARHRHPYFSVTASRSVSGNQPA